MKVNKLYLFYLALLSINLCFIHTLAADDTVIEINQDVEGNTNYKKAEISVPSTVLNHYFKHTVTKIPSSRIGAFRFEFDSFYPALVNSYKVYCTFVDQSTSDAALIEELRILNNETSACVGAFNQNGIYDGIIEYDKTKTKMGIYLFTTAGYSLKGRIYLLTTEKSLSAQEQKVNENEIYSLIPFSVVISDFRDKASKILFYSYTRELQMYYAEEDSPRPEKLFSGNIMNVYTNPNMVRQKYHNANIMVLLTKPFAGAEMTGETFKFQVKFLASQFLLDYFVSANPDGRSTNTPLSLNMTSCEDPYYVIVNYNKPEAQRSLYIDLVYGKMRSISVATKFTKGTWEEMIDSDMSAVDVTARKYVLPRNQATHMDVFKVQCSVPFLLNFYYVDDNQASTLLEYGKVVLTTLKANKPVSLQFKSGIVAPQITIEVFNPFETPFVHINDGQNEYVVQENTLIKTTPFNTLNGIVIKERGGSKETRIIVKVGYDTHSWAEVGENIKYDKSTNTYAYIFPNDDKKLNYTYVNLAITGTNQADNVKFCYGTNLGAAVPPSKENCYRVSKDNGYTLKLINPYVMYKDYEIGDELIYYATMTPTSDGDSLSFKDEINNYSTLERNYEGINNMVTLPSGGEYSTILTAPKDKNPAIITQIASCDNSAIKMKVLNAYNTSHTVVPQADIPAGKTNYYNLFSNIFLETELVLNGNSGTNVFVKHVGINILYNPRIKDSFDITFNQNLNELDISSPLENVEPIKYTVYVTPKGGLSSKSISLCTFTDQAQIDALADYTKSTVSSNVMTSLQINFVKAGLKTGDSFEAIVYAEQQGNSYMNFLSPVLSGTVGEISTDSIYEIKNEYSSDTDYAYLEHTAKSEEITYYFTYTPERTLDYPVGAFSIELDADTVGSFSHVDCAFVNEGDDAMSMIEAVEDVIEKDASYCIGGRSTTNDRRYNYFFKYATDGSKFKKLIIKVSNGQFANGKFTIYVRKGEHTYLKKTDFVTQEEYGRQEEYKKSVMPYIVDLKTIRGEEDAADKVSKLLIYSQHLEMQMYYIDENQNAPVKLFTGNIMLVYTKLTLAIQKYHATTLVLLSENLEGQEHSSLGNVFRFHTKMFRSEAQIEYFVSNNKEGRTLNYPLSVEMNTCTSTNNKYYYILNYNKPEEERTLHLDMLFGSVNRVRIASDINAERWDSLVSDSMTEIENYQIDLTSKRQHIDVVEFECNTPLLANVYYTYHGTEYTNLQKGDIMVVNLDPNESITGALDTSVSGSLFYSITAFNPIENPDLTLRFSTSITHHFTENALQVGILMTAPESVFIVNNGKSSTRIIFKLGLGVESEWAQDDTLPIRGKLYTLKNKYVYKFPIGETKQNYINVKINVKPLSKSGESVENIKFCYSTSVGMAIDSSKENCFRTGANIPYELTFINPLIAPKNYKTYSDNYYVSLTPFDNNDLISLEITENTYDATNRNVEGKHNVIKLNDGEAKTILSIPEVFVNKVFVELKACVAEMGSIEYINSNAYTGEEISTGTIRHDDSDYYYTIEDNLMETQIAFNGSLNDKVFVKHVGLDPNYKLQVQVYDSKFDQEQNTVTIEKPVHNEAFSITVLVGRKGRFADYTLCTFAEIDESKYSTLGDYVKTFSSVSSNQILHFIDFRSFNYKEGEEFDLLVYAVQSENTKLEFLYNVISGVVGKIQGVVEVKEYVQDQPDVVTATFAKNNTSNYLFYDFARNPEGDVASIKIVKNANVNINKIGCVFVKKNVPDDEMISEVNKAVAEGRSVCVGDTYKDTDGYDGLVNAAEVKSGYGRLVVQVMYGLGEENEKLTDETVSMTINIRVRGFAITEGEKEYKEDEKLAAVPYVLDLEKIREQKTSTGDYVSKVLLFSNTREMQMFYISEGAPTELFTGNIMLVYTNLELVKQKYQGATTLILITDSLNHISQRVLGESFRFKTSFFNSAKKIEYYVSANSNGRLLDNPTAIEMVSCDQPYYYILNYHYTEGDRLLNIDTVYGEVETFKMATALNQNNWNDLIDDMETFNSNEIYLQAQTKFHFDVIEVTCKIPVLLNLFYTDPENPKVSNLDEGDISIVDLAPGESKKLTLKAGLNDEFIYSFNVHKENGKAPNVKVTFSSGHTLQIKENGVFTYKNTERFSNILIENVEAGGSDSTRVIFKFGYSIEKTFTKIENDMYNLQTPDRAENLFAYMFKKGEDRLNYTKVEFTVSTKESNVKFCYISNLGAFIDPSQHNCFRVGQLNPYTITVLNPYVMHKNYKTGNSVLDYYVGFRTVLNNTNITITPNVVYYDTKVRNMESVANSASVPEKGILKTILTSPEDEYLFVHIDICTKDKSMNYEFKNAYNDSSLANSGEIQANTKNNFKNILNTRLDTELNLSGDPGVKVYVKHVGVWDMYQPVIKDMNITYEDKKVTINQPIEGEEFRYTVLIDKRNQLKDKGITLCDYAESSRLAHYSKSITSKDSQATVEIDFSDSSLKGYNDIDIQVVAVQVNNGKVVLLSEVLQSASGAGSSGSNVGLIVVIIVLVVVLVVGGAAAFIFLTKYKKTMEKHPVVNAAVVSLADVNSAGNEKLVQSQAQE